MNGESGERTSLWMATGAPVVRSPLQESTTADVCVVGAGIAGMTTAYLLAKEGRSVVVLDDGPVGGGQTERTSAHLSNAIDDRYTEIERLHGGKAARLAAQSHTAAIDRIEQIAAEEGIDCDFRRIDGYLFVPPGESIDTLYQEMAAAHRAGLADVEMVDRAPLSGFDTGRCLRFPRQGRFHPLKYLAGLAAAIEGRGGRLFTGTHAARITGGQPARVETGEGRLVTAGAVVVATNTPVNDRFAIHTKQSPYLSYVIGARVPHGSVTDALFWDTVDPYHYVRVQPAGPPGPEDAGSQSAGPADWDLLLVGGEDHKTGQADDFAQRYARLEAWAFRHFPMIAEVQFRWSGQVMEPIDGLAYIGRNPGDEPNVFIATGDSGMGLTHGTIAGLLLTDLIQERDNPWTALYDPSRKSVLALAEFARENFNIGLQYIDWLTPGEVDGAAEIPAGSGAVLRRGLTKVAAYRDDEGRLHQRSAVCGHLGCIVAWNDSEKTWDCPCHGSRFDRFGKVINGPANRDLSPG